MNSENSTQSKPVPLDCTLSDKQMEEELRDHGWHHNHRGWWHPPMCLASWPLHEAYAMLQRDKS